mmetsp:Transcript_1828/g.4096  ORF Transcript_1828/g.4096 Transcript_1828/m.4096 type:complete len:295 (+) Transcript_1828:410-1294(+)
MPSGLTTSPVADLKSSQTFQVSRRSDGAGGHSFCEVTVTEDKNVDECTKCGKPGLLVCCDKCERVYHLKCIGLKKEEDLPEGDWFCEVCVTTEPIVEQTSNPSSPVRAAGLDRTQPTILFAQKAPRSPLKEVELSVDVLAGHHKTGQTKLLNAAEKLVHVHNLVHRDSHWCILLRKGDELRGALVFRPCFSRQFVELAFCVIPNKHQRKGYGQIMLSRLRDLAVSLGLMHICALRTTPPSVSSRKTVSLRRSSWILCTTMYECKSTRLENCNIIWLRTSACMCQSRCYQFGRGG